MFGRGRPVVCIPWRDSGEPHRAAAFDYATSWWSRNGFQWCSHPGPADGMFNIAAARNQAAEVARTVEAEVLVFADADTVPDSREQVMNAVYEARICRGAIYPHDHYWSLTQGLTTAAIVGRYGDLSGIPRDASFLPYYRTSVSGLVVCTVDSWEAAGRWDEGFQGWGNEDVAFALMARDVLGRALRIPGHVYHLWHPRNFGYPTEQPDADRKRLAAYRQAAEEGPHALRALRESLIT